MENAFKKIIKCIFFYALTGGLYLLIETGYRQYTFVEMFYLAGFVGLIAMAFNNLVTYEFDFLLQVLIVTGISVYGEGIVGHIWNTDFHMWDYRELPFTFWGNQVNLVFALFWLLLVILIIPVLDYVDWKLFDYEKDTPPYYKVFGKKIYQFKK